MSVYVCDHCGRRVPAELIDTRYYIGPGPPIITQPGRVECCDHAMRRDDDESCGLLRSSIRTKPHS